MCAPCVLRACSVRAPCVPPNVSHTFVVSATLEQKGAPQLEDGSSQTVGTASPVPEWTCSLIGQGALHCSQCLRTMDAHMNNELHGVFLDYRFSFTDKLGTSIFRFSTNRLVQVSLSRVMLFVPAVPLSVRWLCFLNSFMEGSTPGCVRWSGRRPRGITVKDEILKLFSAPSSGGAISHSKYAYQVAAFRAYSNHAE